MAEAGEPSEAELRAYLEQLRGADVTEVVAQAYTMLGTAAEVKLGRPDARTVIDAMGGLVEGCAARLPEQLAEGMRQGIAQLKMAQVQVEQQLGQQAGGAAGAGAEAQGPEGAPGAGAGQTQGPGAGQTQVPGHAQAQADQRLTDRLWVPGRGTPPPAR